MKKFMITLVLIITTTQSFALGRGVKNKLPRLAGVDFSQVASLPEGKLLLTKPLAVLPITALDASVHNELYRAKLIKEARVGTAASAVTLVTAGYGLFFMLAKPPVFPIPAPEFFGVGGGFIVSFCLIVNACYKLEELGIIKDASERIAIARNANQNNLVTYKHEQRMHIGILNSSEEDLTVVDALGNETAIESEQLQQLVVIRDGLLPEHYMFMERRKLTNISPDVAEAYIGKEIAYTISYSYVGGQENHLGIVKDVSFDADGQGQIVVGNRLSGEELIITRGEHGEPVVYPTIVKQSLVKFRGVVIENLD